MPNVSQERSGWRDSKLSLRHRLWGWDCPAVDIDFLMIEYNHCRAVTLVEYKHELAAPILPTNPSIRAIIDLADRAGLPAFIVRYAADLSWWRVAPLNHRAADYLPERRLMSEREYVALLYRIRGMAIPAEVYAAIGSP